VNLLQLDGFNPLVVRARYLSLDRRQAAAVVKKHLRTAAPRVEDQLVKPFVIGAVLKRIEDDGIGYRTGREALAGALLEAGRPVETSFHAQGYWTDHWFYNLDLLESFEGVSPEGVRDLLYRRDLTFYDSAFVVMPRKDKYVVKGQRMWQQEAVREDGAKREMIGRRAADPCLVRTNYGKGAVYRTTLAAKFLCLVANKAASLDAFGIGMEMESEKPDWCDAMNGLPGRFGSSLSESLELKRLCLWLLKHVEAGDSIELADENPRPAQGCRCRGGPATQDRGHARVLGPDLRAQGSLPGEDQARGLGQRSRTVRRRGHQGAQDRRGPR
jgi:hypothetical protein